MAASTVVNIVVLGNYTEDTSHYINSTADGTAAVTNFSIIGAESMTKMFLNGSTALDLSTSGNLIVFISYE